MKTETSPYGRDVEETGYPTQGPEMVAAITKENAYVARGTVANLRQLKSYLKKALQNQLDNKGFSFVESLSGCPTNWSTNAKDTWAFIEETMPNKEDMEQEKYEGDDEAAEEGSVVEALMKRPVLMLFSIGRLVNQFVYSCIGFAIPLQLAQSFGSTLGPKYFGILMSFTGLVVITFTMPATKLTLKLKPLINIAFAGFFYAIGFGMIGFIDTLPLFLLSSFIFTVGEVLEATNAGAYIANHSPITHRGRFNALITMITSIGGAVGPYFFGKFITAFGLFDLWILCFSLTFASGLFMFWLRYYERSRECR
jgi:hypothetical protein